MKEDGFKIENGKLWKREGGGLVEQRASKQTIERIKGNLAIRDLVRENINAQMKGENADAIRLRLNRAYDAFVKIHGFINEDKNRRVMRDDPDWPLLSSLEKWNKKTKTATKTDMFEKDTVSVAKKIDKAESVAEALGISLNELGTMDLDRIASLTGKTKEEAGKELLDQKLAYEDPKQGWKSAKEYLS